VAGNRCQIVAHTKCHQFMKRSVIRACRCGERIDCTRVRRPTTGDAESKEPLDCRMNLICEGGRGWCSDCR
jgi:hypothetical protein